MIMSSLTVSFMPDGILQVLPINKHLIDDSTSEDIINLHTQKAELTSQITTLQDNINNIAVIRGYLHFGNIGRWGKTLGIIYQCPF